MPIKRHHKQRQRVQLDGSGATSSWFLLFIVAFLGWGVILVAPAENVGAVDTSVDRCDDDDESKCVKRVVRTRSHTKPLTPAIYL
jgi:hypothetical protein